MKYKYVKYILDPIFSQSYIACLKWLSLFSLTFHIQIMFFIPATKVFRLHASYCWNCCQKSVGFRWGMGIVSIQTQVFVVCSSFNDNFRSLVTKMSILLKQDASELPMCFLKWSEKLHLRHTFLVTDN